MPPHERDLGRAGPFHGRGPFFGPNRPDPWRGYGRDVRPGYGGDFRPHTGYGGNRDADGFWREGPLAGLASSWDDDEPVFGPARYGLGPYHQRLRTRRRPDDEVKQEVEEALFYDTWVDAEAITVDVSDGVVTLRGELPDYDEVRYATDDAWDVDGVQGVRSELRVDATRRPPVDQVGRRRGSSGAGNG